MSEQFPAAAQGCLGLSQPPPLPSRVFQRVPDFLLFVDISYVLDRIGCFFKTATALFSFKNNRALASPDSQLPQTRSLELTSVDGTCLDPVVLTFVALRRLRADAQRLDPLVHCHCSFIPWAASAVRKRPSSAVKAVGIRQ